MVIVHTRVQEGVRIEVAPPYSTTYPQSCATLRMAWGNARAVEVQLSRTEARILAGQLAVYADGAS